MSAADKKRYILYSKDDGRPDHIKPCAFFNSAAGCRNGGSCKFSHALSAEFISQTTRQMSTTPPAPVAPTPAASAVTAKLTSAVADTNATTETSAKKKRKEKKEKAPTAVADSKVTPINAGMKPAEINQAAAPMEANLLQMQAKLQEQQQQLEAQIKLYQLQTQQAQLQAQLQQQQHQQQQQQQQQQSTVSSSEKKRKRQPSTDENSSKSSKTASAFSAANLASTAAAMAADDDDNDLLFGAVNHVLSKGQRPSYNGQETAAVSNGSSSGSKQQPQQLFVTSQEALTALQTSGTPHATHGTKSNQQQAKRIFANPKIKFEVAATTTTAATSATASAATAVAAVKFDAESVDFASLPWQQLAQQTQQHARFQSDYNFAPVSDQSWVSSRPPGDWCKDMYVPSVIAIDCEMCETTDPVDGSKNTNALIRLSVIDGNDPNKVLIDTLVNPGAPVSDSRTRIHGISEEQMAAANCSLRQAQAALLRCCGERTIVVGHSVHNDLRALRFNHNVVVDTAYLYTLHGAPGASPGLREVSEQLLGLLLPHTHDSVQDARVSLYAAAKLLLHGPQPAVMRQSLQQQQAMHSSAALVLNNSLSAAAVASSGTISSGLVLPSLFVHRIPDFCSEQHINDMLLGYTNIVPVSVSTILRPPSTTATTSTTATAVPAGKATVLYSSQAHCDLAFESIAGPDRPDKQQRSQKRVYLKSGGYICVRK